MYYKSIAVLHRFPENIHFKLPEAFTDPFRYYPHESVKIAAEALTSRIDSDKALAEAFSEGKMLGVLVCTESTDPQTPYYLAAFSGNVGGNSIIEGFVPPIYDLTDPDGEYKKQECEITKINNLIQELLEDSSYIDLAERLTDAQKDRDEEIENMRSAMAHSKAERERLRQKTEDSDIHAQLIRQSQFEKAEFKRLKSSWDQKIAQLKTPHDEHTAKINQLTKLRAAMSDNLQKWIFQQYLVHNYLGECTSIGELFAAQGLTPPGGTGECAAPKLLEYAYRNNLKPIAMGEFWYGKPSETAVRTHGRFYPSCTSKCGPLLGYMLKGLNIGHSQDAVTQETALTPTIIYEDSEIIVVEKPSGMPSVPGLDGRRSLQEWLTERELAKGYGNCTEIHAVHRLDMDTSGVMIFAKTHMAAADLRQQFEDRSVNKTYMARLCPRPDGRTSGFSAGDKGVIDLPLAPDYDERPRQKVDLFQGKPAHTDYEVISVNSDGTTDILLYPKTGRTHQLRVHCAHHLGLSRPIVGDMLYGGHYVNTAGRLCLHAFSITFRHPSTGEQLTLTASGHLFPVAR